MNTDNYVKTIFTLSNPLRGFFRTSEMGKIIISFVFLKRIDQVIELDNKKVSDLCNQFPNKSKEDLINFFSEEYNIEFFNISNINLDALKDSNDIENDFKEYIGGFSPMIKDILDNLLPPNLFNGIYRAKNKKFFAGLSELDLSLKNVSNEDMGEIFEYLIYFFAKKDDFGEQFSVYTPKEIVKLMTKIAFINSDIKSFHKSDSLKMRSFYDSCAGSGGFLNYANRELKEKDLNFELSLYGQELNSYSHALCKANLLLNGLDIKNIKLGDSLCSNLIQKRDFDYLVSVPPFGENWVKQSNLIQESTLGHFVPAFPKTSDSSFLFLLDQINRMKRKAKGGGRASILLFKGPLSVGGFRSGENKIREYLIEQDLLESIIALPENLFYSTSIPTFIWNISNNKPLNLKNKVCFIDARPYFIKKNIIYEKSTSRKEILPIHEIENIQNSYADLINDGKTDNINFKLIDSENFIRKEILITAENENFIYNEEKKFKTLISDETEIKDLFKKHSWLGDKYDYQISKNNVVQFEVIESFNKKTTGNKPTKLETEYSKYKEAYLGQIVSDINFVFHTGELKNKLEDKLNDKNKNAIFKSHKNAFYMHFSRSKKEIYISKNFKPDYKYIMCFQAIIDEKLASPEYLVQYFKSTAGYNSLFNLVENYTGFRIKVLRDPLIISDILLPLPDLETQLEILDVKKIPERLINSLTKMSKELNLNPTTSPIIRKKLLEMIRVTEELTVEDHIKELIRNGESKRLEFKQTFSLNIVTQKKDKIISHSALKTVAAFLNSDGGTLLIGVTDKGLCCGCQREIEQLHGGIEDNFLKKIKDSLRDHIGLEFSEFYKVNLIRFDRNILLIKVDCIRSNKECFIGEDFFVRTNPGTDKLTGRKLLEYSKIRFDKEQSLN